MRSKPFVHHVERNLSWCLTLKNNPFTLQSADYPKMTLQPRVWNNQTSGNLKIQSLYTHTKKMYTLCILAYNNQMTVKYMSLVVTDAYNSIQDVWRIRSHSSTLLCHSKPWLGNLYGWLNCHEIYEFVISHITKLAAIWFLSIWNKHFSTSTPLHQTNILKHSILKVHMTSYRNESIHAF